MQSIVSINGKFYQPQDAKISVFDHGLLYGDGVFEGIRSYGGQIFRLKEHVRRLFDSARAIWLDIAISQEAMCDSIHAALVKSQIQDAYLRVMVTRGCGTLGLDADMCRDSQIIIIVDTIALYPDELYETGLKIVTVVVPRNHPAALNPRIKSMNYLNNILAKIEGKQAGCLEALMLNHKGEVAECTGDNIFIVRQGVLRTPPTSAGILEGVTRGAVMELAEDSGMPVRETALTLFDVYSADECFLTGTAAEVIAVVEVDGRMIGTGKPGPVTLDLKKKFHALARGGLIKT
ncbi:MAG: branched-chain-amino-acid transaminase [Pirellulales bacterium]|nr:branched-chain-amino-acid transaminase [Pirellulales bacterium]